MLQSSCNYVLVFFRSSSSSINLPETWIKFLKPIIWLLATFFTSSKQAQTWDVVWLWFFFNAMTSVRLWCLFWCVVTISRIGCTLCLVIARSVFLSNSSDHFLHWRSSQSPWKMFLFCSMRSFSSLYSSSTSLSVVVAVYPRSLRAYRKKRTSPNCQKIERNCINTLDFSISILIIILQ